MYTREEELQGAGTDAGGPQSSLQFMPHDALKPKLVLSLS